MSRTYAKRSYSEAERASTLAALTANGGNVNHTARQTKVPRKTISLWRDGLSNHPGVADKCQEKIEALDSILERCARLYLDRAQESTAIAESKGKDAMTAAAIAIDKMRLLREQPTMIGRMEWTDDDLDQRIKESEARLSAIARGETSQN
jgi:transposase-like protein